MIILLASILSDFRFVDFFNSWMKCCKKTLFYDMRLLENFLLDFTSTLRKIQ